MACPVLKMMGWAAASRVLFCCDCHQQAACYKKWQPWVARVLMPAALDCWEWAQMRSHCVAPRLQAVGLQVSPLERWWRYLWRRKGDVYHLMFDMCRFLDGRLWPEQDKTDVQLFLQLMKHVTGEASAAAGCIPAPSAAPPCWSVMVATADERTGLARLLQVPAASLFAAVQSVRLAEGLMCICFCS